MLLIPISKGVHEHNFVQNSTVSCKVCGKETYYTKIGRCSLCWEMEKGLRMLADKNK